MKDQAKFYVFAGVFGVGILGLLVGIYFWDFAPKAPKPAGDSFVSARNNQATQLPRSVTSTSSDGLHAIVPGRLRVPKKPEPVATRTKTPPESTSRIMPAKPEPVVLKKMNQTLQKLRLEVRILRAEQIRMEQRLRHLQAVHQTRQLSSSTPASGTVPVKNLPGWSVESIGAGQAWIEGPSGSTHVVQAGATLDGFRILAISPDQVLTSRGRLTF